MAYREKDFQTEFGKWSKHRWPGSAVFELKLARGNSLPFSALEEHQRYALHAVKHARVYHKLPDTGYQNPFDCVVLETMPAYVVVQYLESATRRPTFFYLIDIDVWEKEVGESARKSLTQERASVIGLARSFS